MNTVSEQAGGRRGIQSAEIGVTVLDTLVRAGGAMTLKELSGAAQLPPSNCHRYLVSFARTGFVVQDARTGRYDLGPALLRAGLAALARLDPIRIASEALASLIDETGHSGLLAIWAEAGPTIIRWMQGRMAVHTTLAPGATLPLLSSATGRVFLGYLPERQTLTLTKQEDLAVAGNPKLLSSATRTAGCATASGDHIPGLYAAAAPILNFAGEAEVVMTLVSAGHAIEGTAIERLRSHAAEASAHLGWVEPVVSTDK